MSKLTNLIDQFAADLRRQVNVPSEWSTVLVQLLKRLEILAQGLDQEHPNSFELMLEYLRDAIDDRLSRGRW